ncbi:MAG: hypothetical protein ACFFDT_35130, partial [Candidatus Hodarchaeota archaeon]
MKPTKLCLGPNLELRARFDYTQQASRIPALSFFRINPLNVKKRGKKHNTHPKLFGWLFSCGWFNVFEDHVTLYRDCAG